MGGVAWQFFPRSSELPAHLELVIETFRHQESVLESHYNEWQQWAAAAGGAAGPRLESNAVLALVADELKTLGYRVEGKNEVIRVVVLWGPNGSAAKTYEVDALFSNSDGRETVIEVEAGGAVANNRWRKDLFEACLMPNVDYLVIALRNEYLSLSKGKVATSPDFRSVTGELDALYESRRMELPLRGVLVVGY